MEGWVDLGGWLQTEMVHLSTDIHEVTGWGVNQQSNPVFFNQGSAEPKGSASGIQGFRQSTAGQ